MSAAVPDSAPDSAQDDAPGLRVNGAARPLGDGTLVGVLAAEAVNPQARGLAVAVNGHVVARHAWDSTRLTPGDEVEIVKLFAGG
ncbi:MAG: sulfur carrier protein ThiS [Alphaproteobacteria bacterium]